MAGEFKVYKKKEWWREDSEVPDYARKMDESVKQKKEEEYELKRGSDGRNKPSITGSYAGTKGKARAKKTVAEKTEVRARTMKEADYDEYDDYEGDDLEDEGMDDVGMDDEGINDESDVPMEADGEDFGGSVCTCPNCGAKLVIETADEEEAEGEDIDGMDDVSPEEESEFKDDEMGAESEEKDLTVPKFESKKDKYDRIQKKVESKRNSKKEESDADFEKAYLEWKKERMKRIEALKAKGKKRVESESEIGIEYGSDTPDMVKKGTTNTGTKTDVGAGNDDDPDITSSSTPDLVTKGQTNTGTKTIQSEKTKARKAIAEKEQSAVTDPFEDEADADAVTTDDFANLPVDVGADPDAITKYKGVQERRAVRKTNPDGAIHESFDFKKLVRGEYK